MKVLVWMLIVVVALLTVNGNCASISRVWGQGELPADWQNFFGNENIARLNFAQTNRINQQGQIIAKLVERVRVLEESLASLEKSLPLLTERVRVLEESLASLAEVNQTLEENLASLAKVILKDKAAIMEMEANQTLEESLAPFADKWIFDTVVAGTGEAEVEQIEEKQDE